MTRAGLPVLLAAGLCAGGAQADEVYIDSHVSAAGACHAAIPAFDASLRKQPLGIANVGTSTVFVTCAPKQAGWTGDNGGVRLSLGNAGSADAQVTCTAVDDRGSRYYPRSLRVPAGGDARMMLFVDYGDPMRVSCGLPAGITLQSLETYARAG